jgi:hypothetical protein
MIASSVHYLLRRHAVSAKLLRSVNGVYDPETSLVSDDTERYTVNVVFVDNVWQRMRGALVADARQRIIIAGGDTDFEPQVSDRIQYRNHFYGVQEVRIVTDRDTVLAYVCEVTYDAER